MDKVFWENKELVPITHKEFSEFIKGKGFTGRNNYELKDLKAMSGFKPMITGSPVTISSDGTEPTRFDSMSKEYHMQPFYMLKRILSPEFALMEKNMSLNLSPVKMPHSNFKDKAYAFNTGVGKCSCGKTLEYVSERDMKMKLRMHLRFCSNPPVAFDKISVPKKATTLREQQLAEAERMRKVHK